MFDFTTVQNSSNWVFLFQELTNKTGCQKCSNQTKVTSESSQKEHAKELDKLQYQLAVCTCILLSRCRDFCLAKSNYNIPHRFRSLTVT